MAEEMISLKNPGRGKKGGRIARDKYELVHAALVKVIPANEKGVPLKGLDERVAKALGARGRAQIPAVGWYMMAVKLDMEARGEIERLPGFVPQRLRRTGKQR